MPFRGRKRLNPIKSVKHIIDSQGGTVGGTKTNVILANGTLAVVAGGQGVTIGSKVFSIFLNIQAYILSGAGLNNFYAIVYKNPQNNISASDIPDGNAVGADKFRRQVFHQEMAMLGSTAADIPVTIFKGVLRIPKVFQTIREGDTINVQLFTPTGVDANFCLQSIYKSYE